MSRTDTTIGEEMDEFDSDEAVFCECLAEMEEEVDGCDADANDDEDAMCAADEANWADR